MEKTFAEFFAGAGLVRAALEPSGWRCEHAVDRDAGKRDSYLLRFPAAGAHHHVLDVRDADAVLARLPGRFALATASFPCTDTSVAGRRAGFDGAESSAFRAFADVLDRLRDRRPPLVLLENVRGFLTSRGGRDLEEAVATLDRLGYWTDAFLLDAAAFVPQSRVRLFVVGFRPPGPVPATPAETIRAAARAAAALEKAGSLVPTGTGDVLADPFRPFDLLEILAGCSSPRPEAFRLRLPEPAGDGDRPDLRELLADDAGAEWWPEAEAERRLGDMQDASLKRCLDMADGGRLPAFRRKRAGRTRLEVRDDGLAGCLRTPRGGSARQAVVARDRGRIRMRWMTAREYAALQGVPDWPLSGRTTRDLWAMGDAVCVPAVRWIDRHALTPLFEAASAVDPPGV